MKWKGGGKEKWSTEEGEREDGAERQRAVVDITAVIRLSDSLPNAPLWETQSCVTSNAAKAQRMHTCLNMCAHTHTGNACL